MEKNKFFTHKFLPIFGLMLFVLFILFINTNVQADSDTIFYNNTNIKVSHFNEIINSMLFYDKIDEKYFEFHIFKSGIGAGNNPRFYISSEDDNYIYIGGRCDQGDYNNIAIYNYDILNNTGTSVYSSWNFGNTLKIDKSRYCFVYKSDKCKIYTDNTYTTEITNSPFFTTFKVIPDINIEFNENTGTYFVWTDWYDIRDVGVLSDVYAYGEYSTIDVHDPDLCWEWYNFVYEYKENEEGKNTITREGFELWRYGIYSYCIWNVTTGDWVIYKIDWTEEALKGTEAEGCLNPFENLNLYLDNSTKTPVVYSNFIESDLLNKCGFVDFSVSFDNGESFNSINIDFKEERIAENVSYTRFFYKLFSNDTYTFKLTIYDENHTKYEVIKSFSINSYDEIIDINGGDTFPASPFITAYADSDIIRFNTQTFKERISLNYFEDTSVDTLRYKAYYIDEDAYQLFGDNYEDWILMDVGYEEYDKVIKGYPYYFKTEFSFDNLEDGDKFYFVFYDNKLGCFSQVTTYTLENKQDLYTVSQNITFNNNKFQRLYDFFSEHFGFLSYPLEFIINLFNRVFNINYEEPILHIPSLYVPGTDNKIFDGFDFNFNSLLENKAISNIYNIYLVAVDFCIVIAFVIHAKNVAEEVFGKNG